MYKILFIDEEKEVFEYFEDYVEISPLKSDFEIITQLPIENIDEMIELIIKVNPDAIITDFVLNEIKNDITYNVPYTGSDLVKKLLSIRQDFPCFILTSFDDQAIVQNDDVNIVYVKNILHREINDDTKARASFLERVKNQINHYKTNVGNAEKRLLYLIEQRKQGKTDISEESEMIELDSFLESTIDRQSTMPNEFKTLSNNDRLAEILSKVDNLLKKIEEKDGKL
jgi:hypothetical protein